MRNHPDYQSPYTGITALKTGEVAYDAASYLAESEQKSCAIAAGCFVTVRRCNATACFRAGGDGVAFRSGKPLKVAPDVGWQPRVSTGSLG